MLGYPVLCSKFLGLISLPKANVVKHAFCVNGVYDLSLIDAPNMDALLGKPLCDEWGFVEIASPLCRLLEAGVKMFLYSINDFSVLTTPPGQAQRFSRYLQSNGKG